MFETYTEEKDEYEVGKLRTIAEGKDVAIEDSYGQSARSPDELMQYYGLTPENICQKAKELLH